VGGESVVAQGVANPGDDRLVDRIEVRWSAGAQDALGLAEPAIEAGRQP
jgi:hypothetical protein